MAQHNQPDVEHPLPPHFGSASNCSADAIRFDFTPGDGLREISCLCEEKQTKKTKKYQNYTP
jgi:hypothetical protein